MPKHRSYRLLCPIARALDRVGDRWSLLILRDLHAGPARFGELAALPGLASNLLSTRLQQLQDSGLVNRREQSAGTAVYELTEDGEATAPLLFELAAFGARFPAPDDVRRPGNLRTVAVTLKEALRRVAGDENLDVELVVDGEPFAVTVADGRVAVSYGPAPDAPASVGVGYDALVAAGDGHLSPDALAREHATLVRGDDKALATLFRLLGRAFAG